jgi:hypothetical protein
VRSDQKGGFSKYRHGGSYSDWGGLPMDRKIKGGASFSGNERDSVYLNREGKEYVSISGISGLDDPGDGRSFAVMDFDRDGWPDLAVASVTAPTLQLYRNQMGDRSSGGVRANRFIAVRFAGGHHGAEPSRDWSNRDGYGAVVTVDLGDATLLREHRAGDGMAAQNSPTLLVGIGERRGARSLKVRWPSGKTQEVGNVAAGSMVTLYENPAHAPGKGGFTVAPYRVESVRPPAQRDLPTLR